MRARITAALRRRDAGTTLTEMLVVMVILGLVVATTATLTISMNTTIAQNTARQDQIDVARTAVERLSKTTRTAVKPSQLLTNCSATCIAIDSFLQGDGLSMKFYGNLDNPVSATNPGGTVGPSQISYVIGTSGADAGVLIEKVQVPDSPSGSSNGYAYCAAEAPGADAACKKRLTTRRLATGVSTATSAFTYYDASGVQLVPTASGLSATDLAKVMAIEVRLTVQSASSTRPLPTTYIQRITLPNAQVLLQGEDDTP